MAPTAVPPRGQHREKIPIIVFLDMLRCLLMTCLVLTSWLGQDLAGDFMDLFLFCWCTAQMIRGYWFLLTILDQTSRPAEIVDTTQKWWTWNVFYLAVEFRMLITDGDYYGEFTYLAYASLILQALGLYIVFQFKEDLKKVGRNPSGEHAPTAAAAVAK